MDPAELRARLKVAAVGVDSDPAIFAQADCQVALALPLPSAVDEPDIKAGLCWLLVWWWSWRRR